VSKMFMEIARKLTGHSEVRKPRGSLLTPIKQVARRLVARGG